jgi:hypothetical protein
MTKAERVIVRAVHYMWLAACWLAERGEWQPMSRIADDAWCKAVSDEDVVETGARRRRPN